jgi:hypothetical protein
MFHPGMKDDRKLLSQGVPSLLFKTISVDHRKSLIHDRENS